MKARVGLSVLAALVLAVGLISSPATAQCPKDCKVKIKTSFKACKAVCKTLSASDKKSCKTGCKTIKKTHKMECKSSSGAMGCSPSGAFLDPSLD